VRPIATDLANYNNDLRTSPFFKNPGDFLKEGQRVRARFRIFDLPGKPDEDWGWVSANAGEMGTVVHAQEGLWPTVRFDQTGCATCVTDFEVVPVPTFKKGDTVEALRDFKVGPFREIVFRKGDLVKVRVLSQDGGSFATNPPDGKGFFGFLNNEDFKAVED
jgi:hypothetical protein